MDWRYNTIWLDQLPDGELRTVDLNQGLKESPSFLGGSYLIVRGFKSKFKNLEDFPANGSVRYLHLTMANIASLKGASVLGEVKRLELDYCLKLESDNGLSELSNSLEWLNVTQAKKFSLGTELLGLSGLRVLCLASSIPKCNFE